MFTAPNRSATTRNPGRDRKGTCGTCGAAKTQKHTAGCKRYELADPTKAGEFHGITGDVNYFSIRAAMNRAA